MCCVFVCAIFAGLPLAITILWIEHKNGNLFRMNCHSTQCTRAHTHATQKPEFNGERESEWHRKSFRFNRYGIYKCKKRIEAIQSLPFYFHNFFLQPPSIHPFVHRSFVHSGSSSWIDIIAFVFVHPVTPLVSCVASFRVVMNVYDVCTRHTDLIYNSICFSSSVGSVVARCMCETRSHTSRTVCLASCRSNLRCKRIQFGYVCSRDSIMVGVVSVAGHLVVKEAKFLLQIDLHRTKYALRIRTSCI